METDQKNKLQLLLIFGSICLSIIYVNNTTIDGTSFQDVVHRFIPFVANYNPVTVGLVFVIVCFVLAFSINNKSIPKQNHTSENQLSDVKPIVQPIIIKPVIQQPTNSSGYVKEQAETRHGHVQTHKTYNSSKPKKLVFYNYYDRKNRQRFHW